MVALLSQCRAAMNCLVPRFVTIMANQAVVALMPVVIVSDEATMARLPRLLQHCFQIFSRLYSTVVQVQP